MVQTGNSSTAPPRKQMAPTSVPRLDREASQMSAGGRHDERRHRGHAERDRAGHVRQTDPPGQPRAQIARTPAPDGPPGDSAGDEEGQRTECIRAPHPFVGGRRREVGAHRVRRAPVEPQGAGELHGSGQPVEVAWGPHPEPPAGRAQRGHRLHVLQGGRRGEEQRADEERHGRRGEPDRLRVVRDGAEREEATIRRRTGSGSTSHARWPVRGRSPRCRRRCSSSEREDDGTAGDPYGRKQRPLGRPQAEEKFDAIA